LAWGNEAEKSLAGQDLSKPQALGKDLQVIDADKFGKDFATPTAGRAVFPASRSLNQDGFALVEWFTDLPWAGLSATPARPPSM
jgi:hypothetical protein